MLRILPLILLLAACGTRWIAVAPGTAPMDCAAARLAARGYVVDTAFTDSLRIRVVQYQEPGSYADTITAQFLPPPAPSYWGVESRRWYGEGAAHRRHGALLNTQFEVRRAMMSCGIDTWARRPMQPLIACTVERLQARGYAVDTMQDNVVLATLREGASETIVRAALLPPDNPGRVRFTSERYALDDGQRRMVGADTARQTQVRDALSMCGVYGSINRPAWKGPLPGRRP